MKTLIVYELVPEQTKFFVVDGDRSDLNGCFVNSGEEDGFDFKIQDEVAEATSWGKELETPLKIDANTIVVKCGFIL